MNHRERRFDIETSTVQLRESERTEYTGSASRATPEAVLQQSVGNQAMQRLHEQGALQAKLAIGHATDPAEREAERVSEQVLETDEDEMQTDPAPELQTDTTPDQATTRNETDQHASAVAVLQQSSSNGRSSSGTAVSGAPEAAVRAGIERGGSPLPSSTRSEFESRFGADFSDVRVHTDSVAKAAATSINAEAFTMGSDIAFADGNYAPQTRDGRKLLAHELTHVVQQRSARGNVPVQRKDGDSTNGSDSGSAKGDEKSEEDIDDRVDKFVAALNRKLDAIRRSYIAAQRVKSTGKEAADAGTKDKSKGTSKDKSKGTSKDKSKTVPSLRVKKKAASRSRRTAKEQAEGVVAGTSWTCRSAHMADNARHVWLLIGGSIAWNPEKQLKEAFNESVRTKFIEAWTDLMSTYKLKNYKGEDGWARGDAYHLELPGGRVSGDIVRRCVKEYVRLTRVEGKSRNSSFESSYAAQIKRAEKQLGVKKAKQGVSGAVEAATDSTASGGE